MFRFTEIRLLAEEFFKDFQKLARLFFYHPMFAVIDDTTLNCLGQAAKLFERSHANRMISTNCPSRNSQFRIGKLNKVLRFSSNRPVDAQRAR